MFEPQTGCRQMENEKVSESENKMGIKIICFALVSKSTHFSKTCSFLVLNSVMKDTPKDFLVS